MNNDQDKVMILIELEKNLVKNYATAITEASNRKLEDMFLDFFDITESIQRDAYELAWNNGWYELEEVEAKKITETTKKLNQRMDELSN